MLESDIKGVHTINLLRTICQKALFNVKQQQQFNSQIILPKKSSNIKPKKQEIIQLPKLNNQKSQMRKLGMFQFEKNIKRKIFKPVLDIVRTEQFCETPSFKVIHYLSSVHEINEIKTTPRIKNRKFKFNSLQF